MKGLIYNLVYSAKRASQILLSMGIKVVAILEVKMMKCCVWVKYRTVNGVCSLFISVRAFLRLVVGGRKQRSVDYTATRRANKYQWDVINNNADIFTTKPYLVVATPHSVTCNCEDYKQLSECLPEHPYLYEKVVAGKRACKHIYSVLTQLGVGSLREYYQQHKQGGRLYEGGSDRNPADDLFQAA